MQLSYRIYIYVGCSRRCEGALAIYDAKYLYRIIRPGVFETHLQVKLDPLRGHDAKPLQRIRTAHANFMQGDLVAGYAL